MKFLEQKKYSRILGVDPSSQAVACCLIVGGVIQATAKIEFGDGELYRRLRKAKQYFPKILEAWNPELVAIEQTILIQNPEVTRKLSYTVGILMGEVLCRDIELIDVPPQTWKSFLGVKSMTKKRKEVIIAELGDKAGRKEINRLKKSQVQDIMSEQYPNFNIWGDDDISDAGGISLWAWKQYGI